MEKLVANQLVQAAKVVEDTLDAELEKLEQLDGEELETIRKNRVKAMQEHAKKKQEWLAKGHGEYSEIPEEKEFFNVTKNSENVVVHFYRDETFRCKIVDKHLSVLAKKHVEAKFCKINAEKCPFLCERLRIKVIPTIILISDAKTKDYIVGFTDLGNKDDFSTEMMEWRIAQAAVIEYSGDMLRPPEDALNVKKKPSLFGKHKVRSIRDGNDIESDEDDW